MSEILDIAWFVIKVIFCVGIINWLSAIESKIDNLTDDSDREQ